jgi:ubiquinone/menaquinone biosynthesis C-methylase UbiE
MVESRYIDKRLFLSRYADARTLSLCEARAGRLGDSAEGQQWFQYLRDDFPKFIPYLTRHCGIDFRGRILEIGAGGAWLSAELSKLPAVVEVIATDFSPAVLKEQAPRVFKLLRANTAKITRMPADFHKLDFADNYFDFVVSSAVLRHAANIVQVLREAKRVLKPGGQLVAIREPVWPLVKIKSTQKMLEKLLATGINERFYTLDAYKEFFRQAAFPLEVKRVNLATGFKYYLNVVVNGFTHARYAFVGSKRVSKAPSSAALRKVRLRSGGPIKGQNSVP